MEAVAEVLKGVCTDHLSLHEAAVSARLSERDRPNDSVEIRVRCLWLCASPGGGMVRMLVQPSRTTTGEVLKDFCTVMGLSAGRCAIARIDMVEAARHALTRRSRREIVPTPPTSVLPSPAPSSQLRHWDTPGVHYLSTQLTLSQAGIGKANPTNPTAWTGHQEILDIIYMPR